MDITLNQGIVAKLGSGARLSISLDYKSFSASDHLIQHFYRML